MQLSQEWDKAFPKSVKVEHKKVTVKNRYGITFPGNLYLTVRAKERLAALAVVAPFSAVKEQSSGLHAQTMPERGRPARWKMAIVTSIAIYPLLVVLIPLFRPVTSGHPNSIAVIEVILVAVPIMTWAMLPLLTWLLREWLAPRPPVVKQPRDEPTGTLRRTNHVRSAV